jgi:hypothetical protein
MSWMDGILPPTGAKGKNGISLFFGDKRRDMRDSARDTSIV